MASKRQRFKLDELRQRFRLTQTEKRVAVFVAAAFMLGLVTKCYRDAHPSPTPGQAHSRTTMTSRNTSKKAYETRAVESGDHTKRARKSEEKLNLPDSAGERYH